MRKTLALMLAALMALSIAPGVFAVEHNVEPTKGTATIIVTVGDVWGDGTGYQMLLDADANAFENGIIPVTGPFTQSGDALDEIYAEFEYKMPDNADGALDTTNILFDETATLEIPAGTYDFCFTNPTPGDCVYLANASNGSMGRVDNYVFTANTTYYFNIAMVGDHDYVDMEFVAESGPAISVALNHSEATMEPGNTLQLVATMEYPNTTSVISGWTSSNTSVATVDDNGLVTAVANGQATITVTTDNGLTATCAILVSTIADALNGPGMNFTYTNDPVTAWLPDATTFTNRNVGATTIQGMANTSTTLSLTVDLAADELFTFDWLISCEGRRMYTEVESEVASESSWYDYVTFKANGEFVFAARGNDNEVVPLDFMETYIFYPTEAGTYTFEWTYNKDMSADHGLDAFFLDNCIITTSGTATEISVTPTEVEIQDSQIAQLTATVLPATADDLTVTWSSSDESVATVDENGLVYGVAPGTATITATSNSNPALQATVTITVLSSEAANRELRNALNVEGGSLPFLNDNVYPWLIDNTTYEGRVAAKSATQGIGDSTTTISLNTWAEAGKMLMFDWFASTESVNFDYLAFYVNGEEITRIGGATMTDFERYAYEIPEDGMYSFEWTYRKDATYNNGLDTVWLDEVELNDPPALEGIVVNPTSALIDINGTKAVTVSAVPTIAELSEITWTTSDASVATVEDGVITGVALGTATITATSAEGFTATVAVEVIEEIYAYGYASSSSITQIGVNEFALLSNVATFLGDFELAPYAMEYVNGTLYAYAAETDEDFGTIMAVYFIVADADTLEYSMTQVDTSDLMYDMAYDHSTGTIYGLGTSGSGRGIFAINPYTGTASLVAPLMGSTNAILTLACSTDGQLYGVEVTTGILNAIDKATGECTAIGATGFTPAYAQSMAYDHNNDILLWAAYSRPNTNGIYVVDTITGEASELYPDVGEICGLYVEYEGTPLPEYVPVTGVTVEPTTAELEFNESIQLTATVLPENASDRRVIWSSNDPFVARVDNTGLVTARGEGSAVITATTAEGDFTATCTVTCSTPEIGNYVYIRTDEILPGEIYVVGAVDAAGEFYVMTDEFGIPEGNVQIAGAPAVLGTYEGQEAVIAGITISEEWLFEASGNGVTIRNQNSQRYANPAAWNGYYWLSLTDTSDMHWIWDSANQYFVASNASLLGSWSNLAYGNSLNDPTEPNAFDIFAAPQAHFDLQLYVRQEVGEIPTEPPTTEPPTTEPPTTEPPTTEPPTTEPPTTEPPTTEPPTTEPPVVVTYTVTFEDWDGTVLKTEEVEEGGDATPPADPTRTNWVFAEWEGDYTNVTADVTITATYVKLGDTNIDDKVNTGDAALTLRYAVGLVDLSDLQLVIADANLDGKVNTGDAAMILGVAVGTVEMEY